MTERQEFWMGLLQQMREFAPHVGIYTDNGLILQASVRERREYGHSGNSLKCIKEPGVVEQFRLWLPSPYNSGQFTMVRAWALPGMVKRNPRGGLEAEVTPVVEACRRLRDTQPGADFYCGDALGSKYGRLARDFDSCCIHQGDNTIKFVYDLREPRNPRQQLAHRLWRRPARNYEDRAYGTYNKAMLAKMLNWADEAREQPEKFSVLTFGSTPIWFPRTMSVHHSGYGNRAVLMDGDDGFVVRETIEEARAILMG